MSGSAIGNNATRTIAPRGSLDLRTHRLCKLLGDVRRSVITIINDTCGYYSHLRHGRCDVDERFVDRHSL